MAKATVHIKQSSIAPGNVARLTYDLVIDQGGYQLRDLEMDITIGTSITQVNNSIRSKAVQESLAQTGVTLVNADITIFGGAQ